MTYKEYIKKYMNDEIYQKAAKHWSEKESLRMPEDIAEEAILCAEDICLRMPSYMRYETQVGKKEKYHAILAMVKEIRNSLYDGETGLCYDSYEKQTAKKILEMGEFRSVSAGFYLMGLIDIFSETSEEIFEHYKQFETFFKEGVKGILSYYSKENPIFLTYPQKAVSEDNTMDIGASLMIAYALFKGCKRRALLSEKYRPVAIAVFEACVKELAKEELYEDIAGQELWEELECSL